MNRSPNQLLLLAIFALPFLLLGQGSLEPSEAPAPTMKSLGQIEPRSDVLELPGDDNARIIINSPGSYYLSRNLSFPSSAIGIKITSSNVSLDLMGFSIRKYSGRFIPAPAPSGDAIIIDGNGLSNITVKNGHISGPFLDDGIIDVSPAPGALNVRVSHIQVANAGSSGIELSGGLTTCVANCSVRTTGGQGIEAGRVFHCVTSGCQGTGIRGIHVSHSFGFSEGSTGIQASNGIVSYSTGRTAGGPAAVGIRTQLAVASEARSGEDIEHKYLMP